MSVRIASAVLLSLPLSASAQDLSDEGAAVQAAADSPKACATPLALLKDRAVVDVVGGPVRADAGFVVKTPRPASATGRVVWATRGDAAVPVPEGVTDAVYAADKGTLALALPVSAMRPGEWAFGLSLARTYTVDGRTVACPEEQPLDVKVAVPAPTLAPAPATAAWDLVWPWDAWSAPAPRVVQLTETGGEAGVRALTATWVPLADRVGGPASVRVACGPREGTEAAVATRPGAGTAGASAAAVKATDPLPGGVVAGGVRTLDCTLSEIGALGTQTGTIRLDAPSLAKPAEVAVTVNTRVTKVVIPLLIVIAIVFSRWLRSGLHARVAALEAKDRAERAIGRARLAREASADEAFRADVDAAVKAFTGALAALVDAAEIDTRIATLDAAVTTAEAALKVTTERASREVAAFEKAVLPPWRVPPDVAPTLEEARVAARSARADLVAGNPTAALRDVEAGGLVTARLASVVGAFVERVQPLLDAPLPQVKPLVGPLREQRLLLIGAGTEAQARLQALHLAWEPLDRGLAAALDAARGDLVGAIERFAARQDAGSALLPRATALEARPDPTTLVEQVQLHQALALDAAALRKTLLEGMVAASRDPLDVTAALDAGDWARAVTLAGSSGRAPLGADGPVETLTGSRAKGFASPERVAAATPVSAGTPLPGAPIASVPPWSPVWGGLGDARPTREALESARDGYFLVTTVAITILGSVQFSDAWVGTPEDLVNAFAWGLGLDASSAFLFGLAAELRTKASKAWPAPPAAS